MYCEYCGTSSHGPLTTRVVNINGKDKVLAKVRRQVLDTGYAKICTTCITFRALYVGDTMTKMYSADTGQRITWV